MSFEPLSEQIIRVSQAAKGVLHRHGWTQCVEARDQDGVSVYYTSRSATAFCLQGAIRRAGFELNEPHISTLLAVARLTGRDDKVVTDWNDAPDRTFEQVLAKLDEAIEYERSAPAQVNMIAEVMT